MSNVKEWLWALSVIVAFALGALVAGSDSHTSVSVDTSAAREAWMKTNGHPSYGPCNEALRKAWDDPSTRTPRGPRGGGCCGAGDDYWGGVWDSMEEAGAPKGK